MQVCGAPLAHLVLIVLEPVLGSSSACTDMSATNRFLVDNSELKAKSKGLAYRNSKDLLDRDVNSERNVVEKNFEAWGSIVHGIDSGDGWIQVGHRYLPAMFNGVLCVVKADLAQSSKECGAQLKPAFGTGVFSSATKPMSKRPASVLAAEVDEPETLEEGGDNSVCLKTRGVSYNTAARNWIANWQENGKL